MALFSRIVKMSETPIFRFMAYTSVRHSSTANCSTPVDVANIRLERPKPKKTMKWVGLEGLDQRTGGSLIPETLQQMGAEEAEMQSKGIEKMSHQENILEDRKRRRRALDRFGLPDFQSIIAEKEIDMARVAPRILQMNIGLYCNQACSHCHVDSSPRRKEMMSTEVMDACLALLRKSNSITTLDITGGAPEFNPHFRYLVKEASKLNVDIIDRCNLTVLQEPGQEDLADFLAAHKVHVIASLPCYGPKNVNMQRGSGVFDRSIRGILQLNEKGYGVEGSGLVLDLVYNPLGAFLPPPQAALEAKYKEELFDAFGIVFNHLMTITNMPILRFADFLYRRGELEEYMQLLVQSFSPAATQGLMCKNTINVRWDGKLYDCDFNQQLSLGMGTSGTSAGASVPASLQAKSNEGYSIFDIQNCNDLLSTAIVLGNHCFGCTAGQGSSCTGATTN